MNSKDRLIITWLFLLMILVVAMSYLMDKDIDAVHKTLEAILEQQEEQATQSTKVANEIESRLDAIEHNQEVQDIRLDNHYEKIQENDSKIQKIEKQRTEVKSSLNKVRTTGNNRLNVNLSEYEIQLLAKLVYCEAGSTSYRCQKAVVSVIVNRMKRYHKTASQVIFEDGVFSVSYKVRRTTPSSTSLKAVRDVLRNGTTLPRSVVAFRYGHYHSFGRRYCRIDGVCFTAM